MSTEKTIDERRMALLQEWNRHGEKAAEKPETFKPTFERPIVTYEIGRLDGERVYAYGAIHRWVGMTGDPQVTARLRAQARQGHRIVSMRDVQLVDVVVVERRWFLDEHEAATEALLDLWNGSGATLPFKDEPTETKAGHMKVAIRQIEIGQWRDAPVIIYRALEFAHWERCMGRPQLTIPKIIESDEPFPPIREIHYGPCPDTGEPLIRFMLTNASMTYRPLIRVDRPALATQGTDARIELVHTWKRTRRAIEDAEQKIGEARVRDGTARKFRFTWDERHGKWSASERSGGHTTVYSVDSAHAEKVRAERTYFCAEVARPQHVQTPTFTLVIVKPFLAVRS